MSDRISREELVKIYNVELKFIDELVDFGLLKSFTENEISYILYEELPAFERFANWHYDLEINLPGIDMVNNLLQKVRELQAENRRLANRQFALESLSEDYED